jgi:hypothetical protein
MYWKRLMEVAYTFELNFSGTRTLLPNARFMPALFASLEQTVPFMPLERFSVLLDVDIRDSTSV